mmetsp:Transcript_131004/g.195230  ORF Transcript_131004/g.195230 Transcript_131004/m.195230 type:complete len:876 (-) Transcript_131004:91-2718(-)
MIKALLVIAIAAASMPLLAFASSCEDGLVTTTDHLGGEGSDSAVCLRVDNSGLCEDGTIATASASTWYGSHLVSAAAKAGVHAEDVTFKDESGNMVRLHSVTVGGMPDGAVAVDAGTDGATFCTTPLTMGKQAAAVSDTPEIATDCLKLSKGRTYANFADDGSDCRVSQQHSIDAGIHGGSRVQLAAAVQLGAAGERIEMALASDEAGILCSVVLTAAEGASTPPTALTCQDSASSLTCGGVCVPLPTVLTRKAMFVTLGASTEGGSVEVVQDAEETVTATVASAELINGFGNFSSNISHNVSPLSTSHIWGSTLSMQGPSICRAQRLSAPVLPPWDGKGPKPVAPSHARLVRELNCTMVDGSALACQGTIQALFEGDSEDEGLVEPAVFARLSSGGHQLDDAQLDVVVTGERCPRDDEGLAHSALVRDFTATLSRDTFSRARSDVLDASDQDNFRTKVFSGAHTETAPTMQEEVKEFHTFVGTSDGGQTSAFASISSLNRGHEYIDCAGIHVEQSTCGIPTTKYTLACFVPTGYSFPVVQGQRLESESTAPVNTSTAATVTKVLSGGATVEVAILVVSSEIATPGEEVQAPEETQFELGICHAVKDCDSPITATLLVSYAYSGPLLCASTTEHSITVDVPETAELLTAEGEPLLEVNEAEANYSLAFVPTNKMGAADMPSARAEPFVRLLASLVHGDMVDVSANASISWSRDEGTGVVTFSIKTSERTWSVFEPNSMLEAFVTYGAVLPLREALAEAHGKRRLGMASARALFADEDVERKQVTTTLGTIAPRRASSPPEQGNDGHALDQDESGSASAPGGVSAGAVAGIVVAATVGTVLAVAFFVHRRRSQQDESTNGSGSQAHASIALQPRQL